jgi:hypothetical protein
MPADELELITGLAGAESTGSMRVGFDVDGDTEG